MSNEYGYGVVNTKNNPIQIAEHGFIAFASINEARVYVGIVNSTANLNDYENTPWRVVKLTWSEIDE